VTKKQFSVFLSHDWGQDKSHVNHEKVKHIGSLLEEKLELQPWIDELHNHDNMLFSIAEGIRKSHFFIIFLTVNINEKIKKGHEEKEWCFRELNYAAYKLSPKNVFVVVLEKEMTNRGKWADVLQFLFASDVYFDLSGATKSGDGWDYCATAGWCRLLEKLKGYEMAPLTVQCTKSNESSSESVEARHSTTNDSVYAIGIKEPETNTSTPPLEVKESDSEVFGHSEVSDIGKLGHPDELKGSTSDTAEDNEFSGLSVLYLFLGLATVLLLVLVYMFFF
jgi:hypothetical protein